MLLLLLLLLRLGTARARMHRVLHLLPMRVLLLLHPIGCGPLLCVLLLRFVMLLCSTLLLVVLLCSTLMLLCVVMLLMLLCSTLLLSHFESAAAHAAVASQDALVGASTEPACRARLLSAG